MPPLKIPAGASQALRRFFRRSLAPAAGRVLATKAPNPLDMDVLGIPDLPRYWSENTMKQNLTPQQFAGLADTPPGERLAAGWTLMMVRGSDDFKAGKPVNMLVKLPEGSEGSEGARIAYRFQTKPDGTVIVRRVGQSGDTVASAGFQPQSPPEALTAAVKVRWQSHGFKFEGPWQVGDLLKLHKVLLTLTPRELEHLRDISFKRGGEDAKRAGVYQANGDDASVTYFDGAFTHDAATFVGEGRPYSERTLYHEIGHALLGWADRVLWRQLDDAIKRYNKVIEQYNAGSWLDQQKLGGEFEKARKDYEAAKARWTFESDLAYVEHRFKGRPSPTKYAETNFKEYQAEAYSVFKTEPERLAEFDQDLHTYFSAGDYLRHWQKGGDGKWAPVAVPGDGDPAAAAIGRLGGGAVPDALGRVPVQAARPVPVNAAAAALLQGLKEAG